MKDPIDFHIRSLEQRIDDLTEENSKLTAKCDYQKSVIDRQNVSESMQVQMIDTLKRLLGTQNALRKIVTQYNDYSESVDEQPNQWLVKCCEIAEKAIDESAQVDTEFEIRKQAKEIQEDNKRLREALQKANQYAVAWQAKEIQPLLGENLDADIDYFYSLLHSDQPKS